MAVYDFGISETDDVKAALGDTGQNIGPATTPLNDVHVTEAVQAGARTVHALAFAKGLDNIDATLLAANEATHGMLKDVAIAGALVELTRKHARMKDLFVLWNERYQTGRSELMSNQSAFGDGMPDAADITSIVDDVVLEDSAEIGNWNFENESESVW